MKLAKNPLAFRGRIVFLRGFVCALFLMVVARYYNVQVLNHQHFLELGQKNRVKKREIKATRGLIYDRHQRLITRNLPAYHVVLMRDEMDVPWDRLRPRLSAFLAIDETELQARYDKFRSHYISVPITIKDNADFREVLKILRNRLRFPGLGVEVTNRRDYVYPQLFSHVLGYVGQATDSEIKQADYVQLGDFVGKTGIELAYNRVLTGIDGERVIEVNHRGFFFDEHISKPPQPGGQLFLTLDLDLQEVAQREMGGHGGAVVMMDVKSGEILVYYSAPAFDLNLFAQGMSQAQWDQLVNHEDKPLFNRPIQGLYAPGSVFKIVTAISALENGVLAADTRLVCSGSLEYYGHVFHCHSEGGHGLIDLREALQKSCNVFFYQVASELGVSTLAESARALGFGRRTGIDLLGEKRGLVPDPEWKKKRTGRIWYPGETLSMSIGQGDLQVTLMQLLGLMATVANDGQVQQPHIFQKGGIRDDFVYFQPEISARVGVDASHFELIKDGMWRVVNLEHGTGSNAAVPGLNVCGKTGTAQLVTFTSEDRRKEDRYMNAWFAGFAPRKKPRVAIVVLVERAGAGGANAAPVAARMLEAYFAKNEGLSPI